MALNDDLDIEEYNFSDGDLSSFTSEFSRPKQDMGISEEVTDDDDYFADEDDMGFEGEQPGDDGLSLNTVVNMAQARNVSKGLTVGADALISGFMGMFNNGDSAPFKLTADEKEQVVTSLAVVLKHNNATVSPTWGLVITVLTIYAGKAMILHQLRSERKKQEKLSSENDFLKAELSKLKKNAGRESSQTGDTTGA